MKQDPTLWLLARASGLTAYLILLLSVIAGIAVKTRPFGKAVRPAAQTDTHRMLALLGLGALAVHGSTLVLDHTVRTPVHALFLPFTSTYRPVSVAFGVLSAELLLLVYASFSLRKRIGTRNWRRLHWMSYAIFAGATVHGLGAGTDTARPWTFALYLAAVGSVTGAAAWRALASRGRSPSVLALAPSEAVVPIRRPDAHVGARAAVRGVRRSG